MKTDIEWIHIPSGTATVGSTLDEIDTAYDFWKSRLLNPNYKKDFKSWLMKEYPQQIEKIDKFYMSDILITNELYGVFCNETGARIPESITNKQLGGNEDCPVWGVEFSEAQQFCDWLSYKTNNLITLPTESQWEYAARSNTKRQYPWGNDFNSSYCNTYESQIGMATSVRAYKKGRSYFGLYDMGGNVEEWVNSSYMPHPGGLKIEDDLTEMLGNDYKVLKGGSFARGGDLCRVARRHGKHPNPEFRFTGFRIVKLV
ncbi:formylglycine-generating enzyme family protein [Bacillus wiedmannii]|uniref:formylglycine-generating enzyme family protein n=1 Tax=Bacillus wiedmannii TaxID=1890302 RepID=UPI000BF43589|nr:formylglycine-generating enzyme family protein [Bacillus wiedmannii]PFY98326.1 serine/threonine protein kinase [Bacillus wiedmannii]